MPNLLLVMFLTVAAGDFWQQEADSQSCSGTLMSSVVCEADFLQRDSIGQQISQQERRGIGPASAWHCPASHPIKGNFTTYSGERCIFHSPGGQFYDKTKPEMCYATPADATADGCRASLR